MSSAPFKTMNEPRILNRVSEGVLGDPCCLDPAISYMGADTFTHAY